MAAVDGKVEERIAPTDSGEHDLFSHYVRKSDLDRAIFDGVPIRALCGKEWLPAGDWKNFPVCPTCKEIFERLPDTN